MHRSLSRILQGLIIVSVVVLLILPFLWHFSWTVELAKYPDHIRLVAVAIILLLSWGLIRLLLKIIAAWHHYRLQTTFAASLRAVGYWFPLFTLGLLIIGLLISRSPPTIGLLANLQPYEVIIYLLPLMIGMHAAVTFNHDDRAMLELLLTYPRPLAWLVLEQVALLWLLYWAMMLGGTVAAVAMAGQGNVLDILVRTIPAAFFLTAIGLLITISFRHLVFGALAVFIAWMATGPAGMLLWSRAPFLWPLHPFLPTTIVNSGDIAINRILVTLLSVALLAVAMRQLSNEEFVFSGTSRRSTLVKEQPRHAG